MKTSIDETESGIIERCVKDFSSGEKIIYILANGDISRYHEFITLHIEKSGEFILRESYLLPENSFTRETELGSKLESVEDFRQWITAFVNEYGIYLLHPRNLPNGLTGIEKFGEVIND